MSITCERKKENCISLLRRFVHIRPSVCSHGVIRLIFFSEFDVWGVFFFWESVAKIQIALKSDKNNRYFAWRPIHVYFIISRSVLLRMRNVSDKSCRENQNTHFVFSNFFFENRAVYEITWEKYCRAGQATDDAVFLPVTTAGIQTHLSNIR